MTRTIAAPIHDIPAPTAGVYEIVGPHATREEAVQTLQYINEQPIDQFYPGLPPETPQTPEEVRRIQAMRSAIVDYAASKGVDISDHELPVDKVHFYDAVAFLRARKASGLGPSDLGGSHDGSQHILALYNGKNRPRQFAQTLSHEITHALVRRHVKVTYQTSPESQTVRERKVVQSGMRVRKTGAFSLLREYLTEVINRGSQQFWGNYPELRDLQSDDAEDSLYRDLMPIGDALVARVAKKLGKPEQEVLDTLVRGELTADLSSLRDVASVIGTDGMKALIAFKGGSAADIKVFTTKLGLESAKNQRRDRLIALLRRVFS